jgi:hypothetical protein
MTTRRRSGLLAAAVFGLLLAAAGVLAARPALADSCVGAVDINGAGTTTFFQPFATASNDARTTSIYLASEFGCDGGPISAIEYYLSTIPGQAMNNLTIRVRHTTASAYSVGAFDNAGWTVVYQANTTITTTGWYVFNFSTPFNWDGVRNLEVDVSFNNSTHSTSGFAYYFVGAALRTMYLSCNDCNCGGSTDPLLWTTCGGISRTSWTPRVRFVFPPWNDDCSAVTPVTLTPDVPVTFTGNNLGATQGCALIGGLAEVWHAITLPQYMDITLDYCTTAGPFTSAWGLFVRGCPCESVVWADGYDTTTCGDGNMTFRWAGLSPGTYYYPVLLDPPSGSVGPYVLHVVGALGPGGYCSAGSLVPNCDEYIGRVQVGTIDNSTGCSQPDGYGDYTALSIALTVGSGCPITVTNGHSHTGTSAKCGWIGTRISTSMMPARSLPWPGHPARDPTRASSRRRPTRCSAIPGCASASPRRSRSRAARRPRARSRITRS